MGPKKGKDPMTDENYWKTSIESAVLNEETWKVKVVVIEAAGSDQDRMYINKFETIAAEEKRFVIKNICKTETTFMINQLGCEKKVKDDNLRVFEEGQAYLKDKKDIPSELIALIIKHLILKMKEEYLFIKQQRLEVRDGMRRESATMIKTAEVKGSVSVKPLESPEPSSPVKGKFKKGDQEQVPQSAESAEGKKYNTSLRVRGEEWRDKVYIDDFPIDGPNLYVAVTGFADAYLAGCLIKIGVPLASVVQVRIDCTLTKVPSSLTPTSKRGQSQTEILSEKYLKFWEDLQRLRVHRESSDTYKDTAFIIFSPPYWNTESLSGNPCKVYDELCFLMYDIQDLSRQHCHYLENMDVIHIPIYKCEESNFNIYLQHMQDLPIECVTIYSLLDGLLRAVEKRHALDQNNSITTVSTAAIMTNTYNKSVEEETKVSKAERIVKDVFCNLCKTESQKKTYRTTYGEEYEQHKDPIVINYGDSVKYTTFHLGNINLDSIVWSTLLNMPYNCLWRKYDTPRDELDAKINFHVNVLLSCFDREDIETGELNRLIHILACRKLFNNRSSLKKKHVSPSTLYEFKKVFLKRSILAEPLPQCPSLLLRGSNCDSPSYLSTSKSEGFSKISYGDDLETSHIKFLFDCPDLSELVSAAEIASERPISHMIDDFEHFEDFTGTSALQILLEAFDMFNCVDYKYCEVTDCFVMMFFNSHDKDGIAREEWRSHIPTPLCLQDFFDFVLEEHYDWIQNEEKLYEGNFIDESQSVGKEGINPLSHKSCVETTNVELDLLMEGSLKYQEITTVEEASPETTETKVTSKKTTLSPGSNEIDSKGGKKNKSGPATPKQMRQSFMTVCPASDTSIQMPRKPFWGYDLSNRRVELFGQNSSFYSKDGTQVSSKYSMSIPMNLEYITLNFRPGNTANEFWLHKALGDYVSTNIADMCESVRISSKDHVLINIIKQNYKLPLQTLSNQQKPKTQNNNTPEMTFADQSSNLQEEHYFHRLVITWPNGLITETVHLENSLQISHIKQYYIKHQTHLDEEMRFVSLNGEVVIFRPSGIIDVLQPDGSIIKISKYGKILVQTEPQRHIFSETSSENSKKGKGKDRASNRSKAPSKSSKTTFVEDSLNLEYNLVIDEFETIESNGLRLKWINETPYPIEKLLIRTATDYCLREIFSRRIDGTNILLNKDGVQVVTFPNNTRIITSFFVEDEEIYPEWSEAEKEFLDMFDFDEDTLISEGSTSERSHGSDEHAYNASVKSSQSGYKHVNEKERTDGYISVNITITIEHANFPTITVDKAKNEVCMDSPNGTKVLVNVLNNFCDITLDKATNAKFNGHTLNINYEACSECNSTTVSSVRVRNEDVSIVTKMHQNWMKIKDSFGNNIVVTEEGHISVIDETCSKEIICTEGLHEGVDDKRSVNKSEASLQSHEKCREMYLAKTMRFFVLRRDLTCSELVHRAVLNEYKKNCRWQPWCLINSYDTFGDHRSLESILTPVHLTETEKWLMDSKLADKPKYLTYKDLKKDSGKGFYHWMRPYERFQPKPMKPANVLPERLPRAYILRTLERQWKENERQQLKGAKELLVAILRYRKVMESDSETILHVPLRDVRSEAERRADDIIQALGQRYEFRRIYEDLRSRLNESVVSRVNVTITTKPEPPLEMSVEGELEEEEIDEQKKLVDERESQLKEAEAAEMSPNLKRYWRRRAEEYKEEQFYKYLLREGSVPPYFRNVLGGAIWWDMNNAAGEATDVAERKKMKCVCAEEGTSHTDDSALYFI